MCFFHLLTHSTASFPCFQMQMQVWNNDVISVVISINFIIIIAWLSLMISSIIILIIIIAWLSLMIFNIIIQIYIIAWLSLMISIIIILIIIIAWLSLMIFNMIIQINIIAWLSLMISRIIILLVLSLLDNHNDCQHPYRLTLGQKAMLWFVL